MSLDQIVKRRAYTTLDRLVMAALKTPMPVTSDDVEGSGVPAEYAAGVKTELRALQQQARAGEWGAARRRGGELAREWATQWGNELGPVDHSAQVKGLLEQLPRGV